MHETITAKKFMELYPKRVATGCVTFRRLVDGRSHVVRVVGWERSSYVALVTLLVNDCGVKRLRVYDSVELEVHYV